MNKKGMESWIWILVVVILIVVGIIVYSLMTGDGGSILGSVSIPEPPALPN